VFVGSEGNKWTRGQGQKISTEKGPYEARIEIHHTTVITSKYITAQSSHQNTSQHSHHIKIHHSTVLHITPFTYPLHPGSRALPTPLSPLLSPQRTQILHSHQHYWDLELHFSRIPEEVPIHQLLDLRFLRE
jgi:hypothetical protein